jgi:hypothetical protein
MVIATYTTAVNIGAAPQTERKQLREREGQPSTRLSPDAPARRGNREVRGVPEKATAQVLVSRRKS